MRERAKRNGVAFSFFALFLSLSFLAAVPVAMRVTGIDTPTLLQNLFRICTIPSKLVTDYFAVGCLASTLLNAGLCGLACNLLILISRTRASSTTFAAYILVIAHCFYGLNLINMWPPFIGVIIYCFVTKHPLRKNLHVAMFAAALAPFISDFLFCYPLGIYITVMGVNVNIVGVVVPFCSALARAFSCPRFCREPPLCTAATICIRRGLRWECSAFLCTAFFTKRLALSLRQLWLERMPTIMRALGTFIGAL